MGFIRQKRFQYWGFKDGKVQKLWSEWFPFSGKEEPVQHKGFRGDELHNEYRTIEIERV